MSEHTVVAGIIGAGDAGRRHAKALISTGKVKISAILDVDVLAACRMRDELSFGGECSVGKSVMVSECHLWCVCTPPSTHMAIARTLLSSGAIILLEKPPVISTEEARELIAFPGYKDHKVFVVSQHRFAAASRRLFDICTTKPFGEVKNVVIRVYRQRPPERLMVGWKADPKSAGGGVVMTLGYHTLDLVAWCLGDITEISALSAAAYSGKGETQIVAIGRSGGGLVSMSMGVGANSTAPDEIIFDFERGRVVWCGDELIINGVVTHARSSNASLHNEQIGALVASIADRRPIGITLGESLKTLEVIERIYEASGIQGAENGI